MRILIIGGRGLVGESLVRTAHAHGYHVLATHHSSPPDPVAPCTWATLDVAKVHDIDRVVAEADADVVVNAAYVPGGDDLDAITAQAPGYLAAACHRANARFLQLSTDVVFGGNHDGSYVESDPTAPLHAYGQAKVEAEHSVLANHTEATIVRTSLVYGGPQPHTQENLVTRAASGGDISFFVDEIRGPIAVDDLSAAVLALSDHPGTWHVAGPDAVDRLAFARLLAPTVGVDPAALRGGRIDPTGPKRPARVVLDCRKAASVGVTVRGVYDVLG